jgi:cell division inhibitor SepF
MSILDSVKNRFSRNGRTDNYADEYDDYDYYEDSGYETTSHDYAQGEEFQGGQRVDNAFSISSRGSRTNEHTPLVSNTDVRSSAYAQKYSEQPVPRGSNTYHSFPSDEYATNGKSLAPASNRSLQSLQDAREELEALKACSGIDSSVLSSSSQESLKTASRAYSSSSRAAYPESASRRITSLMPKNYEEIAQVSEAFKAGSVVVLSLAKVDAALAKRLLDFSFGVASALGGSVSKLSSRVFLIARSGVTLTDAEIEGLKGKGIL